MNILRRAFNSPFKNDWGIAIDKQVFVNVTIPNADLLLSFTPQKALYSLKTSYYALHKKGYLSVEFIPKQTQDSPDSPTVYDYRRKLSYSLYPEQIYQLLTTQGLFQVSRHQDSTFSSLKLEKEGDSWTCQLTSTPSMSEKTQLTATLTMQDFSALQELCKVFYI